MSQKNILKGITAGLIGGIAGTYAMTKFQTTTKEYQQFLKENLSFTEKENKEGKKQTSGESEPATVKAAKAISEGLLNKKIKDEDKSKAGQIVHYSFGTTMGGVYGAVAEMKPLITKGAGVPFGAAFWMTADNMAVPAFRLSKSPLKYPPSTHAYAFGAHIVYGLTAEIVRRIVRKVL